MRTSIEQAQDGRFVVGVDFGTTFCSVAFAHSVSPDQVKLVQSWPNYRRGTADDVPTEVYYTDPETREYSWGYSIPQGRRHTVEPLKWFKLLIQGTPSTGETRNQSGKVPRSFLDRLHLHQQRTSYGSNSPAVKTAAELRRLGIQPVEVIQDFLSAIRKVVCESMENTYTREFVAESKVEYVITIPAIWSDSAKALMVQAARKAGYGQHRVNFNLLSEPEAAAAHTLKVIQPHEFKADDTFVICDAGGGTVDLISYRIQSLDPLRVDEVVSGTGDLCGSVFLDKGFMLYMEKRVGRGILDKMSTLSRTTMMKSWEDLKLSFGVDKAGGDEEFEVSVPGLADSVELDIYEGFHTISREDVQGIFDPIIDRVIALVKAQVDSVEGASSGVSAILLVGGFGSSAYLFERLKAQKFGRKGRGVQIVQPVNARTAIARGALLRGLDGSIVKEKRARRWYGTTFSFVYYDSDYREDLERHKEWDSIDRCWRVGGKLSWNIEKGEVLTKEHFVDLEAYADIEVGNPNFFIQATILSSEDDAPVNYSWQSGDSVRRVCSLKADVSQVPTSQFPKRLDEKGKSFYRVDFAVRASILDDVLKFELIYNGKAYGEVSAKYE